MIEHKTIEPETKTAIVMSRDAIDVLRRVVDLIAGGVDLIQLEPASEPEPEPDAPVWPSAPHVWWDGEVWTRDDDGEYQTAGDYWAKSHLDSTVQPVRDGARRFAREAVPVTIVPTAEWEALRQCVDDEGGVRDAAEALVDATEALNGETNE